MPVQTAWLSWDSWADQFMPTIHLLCLANELGFIKVTNRRATRSAVALQTSRQKPMTGSARLLWRFCSCKPRGRGLGLILPLSEKSAWVCGLPPPLLLPPGLQPWLLSVPLFISRRVLPTEPLRARAGRESGAPCGSTSASSRSERGLCVVTR